MENLAIVFVDSFALEALIATLLSLAPKLGGLGQKIVGSCSTTPWIDILITTILWIPWLLGITVDGLRGLMAALAAQLIAVNMWALMHGMAYHGNKQSSGIADFHNRRIG
jgi:hypothetical protein